MRIINPARLVGSHPRPPLIPMQAGFSSIKSLSRDFGFCRREKVPFFRAEKYSYPPRGSLVNSRGKRKFFLEKGDFFSSAVELY